MHDLSWIADVSCDDPIVGRADDEWPGVASSVAPFAEKLEQRDRTGQQRTFTPRGTVGAVAGTALRFVGLGEE